jgi:carbon monoxide dehydrogenase subunit G
MPVITTDILVEGYRRDDVLAWLSEPANHARLLRGAFDGLEEHGAGDYTVVLKTSPLPRRMTYRFDHVDSEHGGRRVHVVTGGKRMEGRIHFSLRTMKPSTNTLVTLHADFDTGGPLGMLVEQFGLRSKLEAGYRQALVNLRDALAAVAPAASAG